MRSIFYICFMIIASLSASAQDDGDYRDMLANAEVLLYTQPEETIKITDRVLHNSNNSNQRIQAHLLNTAVYSLTELFGLGSSGSPNCF